MDSESGDGTPPVASGVDSIKTPSTHPGIRVPWILSTGSGVAVATGSGYGVKVGQGVAVADGTKVLPGAGGATVTRLTGVESGGAERPPKQPAIVSNNNIAAGRNNQRDRGPIQESIATCCGPGNLQEGTIHLQEKAPSRGTHQRNPANPGASSPPARRPEADRYPR